MGKWKRQHDNITFYKFCHALSSSLHIQSLDKLGSLKSELLISLFSYNTNLIKARIMSNLFSGALEIKASINCCFDIVKLLSNGFAGVPQAILTIAA